MYSDYKPIINLFSDAQEDYNKLFSSRTKKLAIGILRLYRDHCKSDETRMVGKQLIRSATSVAANYRAAVRARSKAEKFAKLCIVVEEADETAFWLEILKEGQLVNTLKLQELHDEASEIMMVMSAYRRRLKVSIRS